MILAERRAIRLGQHHTHEVVGLRIFGRDAHGIARVPLGLRNIAATEEEKGDFVGGPKVVRFQGDDATDQG